MKAMCIPNTGILPGPNTQIVAPPRVLLSCISFALFLELQKSDFSQIFRLSAPDIKLGSTMLRGCCATIYINHLCLWRTSCFLSMDLLRQWEETNPFMPNNIHACCFNTPSSIRCLRFPRSPSARQLCSDSGLILLMSRVGKSQGQKSIVERRNGTRYRRPKLTSKMPRGADPIMVFEQSYPPQTDGGSRGRRKAVIIRSDGSAQVLWPSGRLAIAVDAEFLGGEQRHQLFAGQFRRLWRYLTEMKREDVMCFKALGIDCITMPGIMRTQNGGSITIVRFRAVPSLDWIIVKQLNNYRTIQRRRLLGAAKK